jgi:hypothetical protein
MIWPSAEPSYAPRIEVGTLALVTEYAATIPVGALELILVDAYEP